MRLCWRVTQIEAVTYINSKGVINSTDDVATLLLAQITMSLYSPSCRAFPRSISASTRAWAQRWRQDGMHALTAIYRGWRQSVRWSCWWHW